VGLASVYVGVFDIQRTFLVSVRYGCWFGCLCWCACWCACCVGVVWVCV